LGRGRRKRCLSHWREILRAIRCAYAYSNTNCDCDRHANCDLKSHAYSDAMHGKMCTDTATAPHAGTASVRVRDLGLFEIAVVLVRFDHVASGIVNADHSIM
jgi:hypothetical protein